VDRGGTAGAPQGVGIQDMIRSVSAPGGFVNHAIRL